MLGFSKDMFLGCEGVGSKNPRFINSEFINFEFINSELARAYLKTFLASGVKLPDSCGQLLERLRRISSVK